MHLSVGGPGCVLVMWATGKAKVLPYHRSLAHAYLLLEHAIALRMLACCLNV